MARTPKDLVESFYHDLWNQADDRVAREILDEDFRFRGSLGPERRGQDGFIDYMQSVHRALGDYVCIIEDLVTTEDRAAARMTFKGIHRGAFFRIKGERIAELWVLGDIDSVKRQLGVEGSSTFSSG
jgi:predicted ester cyclase